MDTKKDNTDTDKAIVEIIGVYNLNIFNNGTFTIKPQVVKLEYDSKSLSGAYFSIISIISCKSLFFSRF
jgi:hypothetical protein